jgi:signal transduction histidine kinase
MLILLITLWFISLFLLASNPKEESIRWLSASTFCSGCGALGVILKEQIILAMGASPIHFGLQVLTGVLFSFAINWGPYIYLMFAISNSELFGSKWAVDWKNRLFWLGMIPPVLMNVLYPILPSYEPSYLVMSVWVVLYEGGAGFFLFYAFLCEKDVKTKQQRLLTFAILTPVAVFSTLVHYVLHVFGMNDLWRYSPWLTFFIFFYIAIYIKYGFLGVKIKFEKQQTYSTQVISSGISILNHTLNNGLSKIKVKAEEIIETSPENQENARFILNAVSHMFAMLDKIKEQMRDLVFKEQTVVINQLVEETLLMIPAYFGVKNIRIRKHASHHIEIWGDPVHLKELLINLCKNAIEAIKTSGELEIGLSLKKRNQPVVSIRDTGTGISPEKLAKIGEPFWTTKDSNRNYGLGLWYCGKVMSHYGKLEIFSQENQGTTVYLYFSKAKIIHTNPIFYATEVSHEQDQNIGG